MYQATETLMSEHRGIERMLSLLEARIPALEAGDPSPVPDVARGVDFLKNFADGCHHYKEEKLLFPALAAKGLPTQGGPIAVMLHEHDEGRAFIRAMLGALPDAGSGDRAALTALASAARGYCVLLRAHIQKEDSVLFQIANQKLSEAEQDKLATEFERVESEVMGEGTHERYHKMLDDLEAAS